MWQTQTLTVTFKKKSVLLLKRQSERAVSKAPRKGDICIQNRRAVRGGQGWTHRGPWSGRAEEDGHQAPVWHSCGIVVGIQTDYGPADLQRRVVEAGSM